jgi:NitT/TauT family transport system permease protein
VVKKWIEYALPLEAYDPATMSRLSWAFSGELVRDTIGSMYRVLVGFVVGAGLALPLGLAMGSSQRVYAWMNP